MASGATPFDPTTARVGSTIQRVDPHSLIAGRPNLVQSRLDVQRQLVTAGVTRFTPITVTKDGVIFDGNHAVRAAAELGMSVDVTVIDAPANGFGRVLDLPITTR